MFESVATVPRKPMVYHCTMLLFFNSCDLSKITAIFDGKSELTYSAIQQELSVLLQMGICIEAVMEMDQTGQGHISLNDAVILRRKHRLLHRGASYCQASGKSSTVCRLSVLVLLLRL